MLRDDDEEDAADNNQAGYGSDEFCDDIDEQASSDPAHKAINHNLIVEELLQFENSELQRFKPTDLPSNSGNTPSTRVTTVLLQGSDQ